MADWNEFSQKRIIEVKQRVQTVVVYEELGRETPEAPEQPFQKEAIVDSFDRPIQATYT